MNDRQHRVSGISHAPMEKEQAERAKVPAQGEPRISKEQNRKSPSSQETREKPTQGENEQE